jgi:hypothetical protein
MGSTFVVPLRRAVRKVIRLCYFRISAFQLFRTAGIVASMAPSTVAKCLAALPADCRAALSAVRKVINENLSC